jgi:hypothetical protein
MNRPTRKAAQFAKFMIGDTVKQEKATHKMETSNKDDKEDGRGSRNYTSYEQVQCMDRVQFKGQAGYVMNLSREFYCIIVLRNGAHVTVEDITELTPLKSGDIPNIPTAYYDVRNCPHCLCLLSHCICEGPESFTNIRSNCTNNNNNSTNNNHNNTATITHELFNPINVLAQVAISDFIVIDE